LLLEEPAAWQEIVIDGKGNLHLLWQLQNVLTTVWDQVSADGGRSWQVAQGLPVEGTAVALMEDPAGQLHLMHATPGALGHWHWDGSRWRDETQLSWALASPPDASVEFLAVTANRQGKMVVVMAIPTEADTTAAQTLLYSMHALKLADQKPAGQPSPTPTRVSTLTPATPTLEDLPTSTGTIEVEPTGAQGESGNNEPSSGISPVTMTVIPLALLLLTVLGVVIRRATRAEDR
jgi:hypothetical protein